MEVVHKNQKYLVFRWKWFIRIKSTWFFFYMGEPNDQVFKVEVIDSKNQTHLVFKVEVVDGKKLNTSGFQGRSGRQ